MSLLANPGLAPCLGSISSFQAAPHDAKHRRRRKSPRSRGRPTTGGAADQNPSAAPSERGSAAASSRPGKT